ncbi:hypothetical protein [Microcoleus vaginatus]|uniref:hypothetical protein n=1 Tax=Microcoleus vaginatus TaxID=119532 RepID=UPI001685E704|nr:hypothetical protein [Microcoleus sp. FACHB-84]MBD2008245.1 hypothetical protein [Microcoleus sp. FACHB-45]
MSISNYAQHLLRFWVENLDLGDRGIMAIALFMPCHPQIANFPLLNKQYFQ